jgi:hypothetical protein
VKQFAHAAEILLFIAVGQIASCDAGVSYEWLLGHAQRAGIDNRQLKTALGHLRRLGLVLHQDTVRTKHISYAYRIAEESFGQTNREAWPRLDKFIAQSVLTDVWSLKGICWMLDAVSRIPLGMAHDISRDARAAGQAMHRGTQRHRLGGWLPDASL